MDMKWMEIGFTFIYLTMIWSIVIVETVKMRAVSAEDRRVASLFRTAFLFLIVGDSVLLLTRLVAFNVGSLEYSPFFLGGDVQLAGIGNLATGITMTIFYLYVLEAWRRRYGKEIGFVYWGVIAVTILRFIFMTFPQNQWGSHEPPLDWSMYRNIFITVSGLAVATLILTDSVRKNDKPFKYIAYMIFLSYISMWIFIVNYPAVQWIGIMMMVKTVAYMAVAVISYRAFFLAKTN
jgi:hypothetical protein